MADATRSRSNASRAEEMRLELPRLENTQTLIGVRAFTGDEDQPLDQAFAILSLLSSAYSTCAIFGGEETVELNGGTYPDFFTRRNPDVFAEALEGVATLIAVSRHLGDVKRIERENARADAEAR